MVDNDRDFVNRTAWITHNQVLTPRCNRQVARYRFIVLGRTAKDEIRWHSDSNSFVQNKIVTATQTGNSHERKNLSQLRFCYGYDCCFNFLNLRLKSAMGTMNIFSNNLLRFS